MTCRYSEDVGPESGRERYTRPPVKEALCALTFEPRPWSIASPGRLFERIQEKYPADPEQQHSRDFTVSPDQAQVSFGQRDARYLYRDAQGHLLIASQNQLSANAVVDDFDYEGWESLQSHFLDGFEKYRELFGPELLARRLSVRYINVLEIPEAEFDLNKYFTVAVPEVEQGRNLKGFLIQTESGLTQPGTGLILTFTNVESATQSSRFALDLEVYRDYAGGEPILVEELTTTSDLLHSIENVQFERLVTNDARELFR